MAYSALDAGSTGACLSQPTPLGPNSIRQEFAVSIPPWEYVFLAFNSANFPDLFGPVVLSSLGLLAAIAVLYVTRTRALHRHPPYLDLYEWLLWTSVFMFSLLLIFSVFVFDFLFVVVTIIGGMAIFVWVRFVHFPAIFEVYERKLARERYFTRSKFARPEATIRARTAKRRRRR